jgi:hypothetical protein
MKMVDFYWHANNNSFSMCQQLRLNRQRIVLLCQGKLPLLCAEDNCNTRSAYDEKDRKRPAHQRSFFIFPAFAQYEYLVVAGVSAGLRAGEGRRS